MATVLAWTWQHFSLEVEDHCDSLAEAVAYIDFGVDDGRCSWLAVEVIDDEGNSTLYREDSPEVQEARAEYERQRAEARANARPIDWVVEVRYPARIEGSAQQWADAGGYYTEAEAREGVRKLGLPEGRARVVHRP